MHKGDFVHLTKSGRFYHYKDDDCPTYSSIKKGKKWSTVITEAEAKNRGFNLCRHCAKEYAEDLRERGRHKVPSGGGGCAMFVLLPIVGSIVYAIISLV